jgi:translation elongation factor EF-Tu-like GTPase
MFFIRRIYEMLYIDSDFKAVFFAMVVIPLLVLLLPIGIVTCTGAPPGQPVAEPVREHIEQVTELEGRVAELTDRLGRYDRAVTYSTEHLELVGLRIGSTVGTVDEIIQLFDEYQREVERVIQHLRTLQAGTE